MKSLYQPTRHYYSEKEVEAIYKKAKELGYPTTENEALVYLKDTCWGIVGIRNGKWLISNVYKTHLGFFGLTENDFYKLRKSGLKSIDISEIRR